MKKLLSSLLAMCMALSLTVLPASALELEQAKELLAAHYVDGVPQEILELDSLDAILEAIGDPYTFYMTAEQYNAFNQSVNGQTVVGIGATVETAFDGGYRIMSVLPDSPALEAGIQPGDILTAVDGVPLTADVDPRVPIVGEEGTELTLTLTRGGQELEFTLKRRSVDIPIVTYEQQGSAGVINCISFGAGTPAGMQEAIGELEDHTSVWIVDLRSNPGGDSTSTSVAASLFTGGGVMLYFRDGPGDYYATPLPNYPAMTDKPVIVLTSPHSASGSELFAGDIRAYQAGIALGQRSFGKGTAQIVLEERNCEYMVGGEAMKITAYRFFSPDGATNHIVGVLPTLLISPENTEAAALLLSCGASSHPENHLKIDLAGQTFYVNLSEALKEENVPALTELLEALPPSAQLRYSTGKNWDKCSPMAPAAVAEALGLEDFIPRTFSDTADSPFDREINTLATYFIVGGYKDGAFHPEDTITRAQFAVMVASALDLPAGSGTSFSDVKEGSWYAGAVTALADMGFLSGRPDGTFAPDDTISYQEMVSVLNKVAAWTSMDGYDLESEPLLLQESLAYKDFAKWAQIPARNLYTLGALVDGLAPTDPGTREAAAGMLCRLMENIHLIWN